MQAMLKASLCLALLTLGACGREVRIQDKRTHAKKSEIAPAAASPVAPAAPVAGQANLITPYLGGCYPSPGRTLEPTGGGLISVDLGSDNQWCEGGGYGRGWRR